MHNKIIQILLFLILVFLNFSCQTSQNKEQDYNLLQIENHYLKPSREPYAGFTWVQLSGKHFSVWTQKSKTIQIGLSETLPGAFIESIDNDKITTLEMVIQVFELPNGKIEEVLSTLAGFENWKIEEGCTFEPVEYDRNGVKRFVLRPSGKGWEEYNQIAKYEPVTYTCCNYGMGNSGIRYFEIHETNPNKAVFIELGQEAPLFDENTLVIF